MIQSILMWLWDTPYLWGLLFFFVTAAGATTSVGMRTPPARSMLVRHAQYGACSAVCSVPLLFRILPMALDPTYYPRAPAIVISCFTVMCLCISSVALYQSFRSLYRKEYRDDRKYI